MDVHVTVEDATAILRVAGEVDAHNCDQLEPALLAEVDPAAVDAVVVDASELAFIDSSGISALLVLRERVVATGATFELREPTAAVHRVLEITGLLETFGVR